MTQTMIVTILVCAFGAAVFSACALWLSLSAQNFFGAIVKNLQAIREQLSDQPDLNISPQIARNGDKYQFKVVNMGGELVDIRLRLVVTKENPADQAGKKSRSAIKRIELHTDSRLGLQEYHQDKGRSIDFYFCPRVADHVKLTDEWPDDGQHRLRLVVSARSAISNQARTFSHNFLAHSCIVEGSFGVNPSLAVESTA